jgi:hypothetical protein
MNSRQQAAMTTLQNELLKQRDISTPLRSFGASRGYEFTRVMNTSVLIGPRGGLIVPAACSYHKKPLQAAVWADVEFKKNTPGYHEGGHDGGTLETDWRCDNPNCPCRDQTPEERFVRSTKKGGR